MKNQKQIHTWGFIWLCNLVYYFIYRFEFKLSKTIGKPMRWLIEVPLWWVSYKIPAFKRRIIRRHGSIENWNKKKIKWENRIFYNPEFSYASMRAGSFYGASFAFFLWDIHNIFVYLNLLPGVFGPNEMTDSSWITFGGILIITFICINYMSEKDNIYLRYFKEFDKVKGQKRWWYKLLALLTILSVPIFWVLTGILAYKK